MFNYTAMIQRAIEYFPLWTDIRKRYKKSTGGKFLSSIIDEAITTEEAIQDYIDSYFLYKYIGHEDEVMAFAYMAQIGRLEDEAYDIIYNGNVMPVTPDIKEFEEQPMYSFYEDGKIYIQIDAYKDGIDEITLHFEEGSKSNYNLQKVHVWNIFDEYATFVNTRRQENETNKELLDRILYITKNLPNGTEDGIKHAIVSELLTDFPELTIDDIKIERPTPENLIKPYEDYETLLDLLADVNRDVYRSKRWDIDYWEYEFESISYIPHIWDKVVKDWQNGVGSYNDLEVILADKIESTNADIYFYKKTIEAFQKYVYDKYIDDNIHFTLIKYNNILNKTHVKYRITASELEDITEEDIELKIYESNKRTDEIPIQDIAVGWGKDIEKVNNNIIDDINDYHLEIHSKTGYDLIISKANVIYMNKDTEEVEDVLDLMQLRTGFVMNSEYELVSDSNKVKATSIEHFTSSEGLMNEHNYITLAEGFNEGDAVLSLTNKAGLYVNYKYECNTVSIPNSLINSVGGYWNTNNEYVIRGDYSSENKTLRFSIDANYVSFKISDENINATINMTVADDLYGTSEIDLSHELQYESPVTDEPRIMTFTISVISVNDVVLYDFEYNNYVVQVSTKYGSLTPTASGFKLSNFYTNELRLHIEAKSGINPIFYGLYIGENFENIVYISPDIPHRNNCIRTFEMVTNGTIDLIRADGFRKENFKPITLYKATTDAAYLRVDLSAYDTIEKIELEAGTIEMIEESGEMYYNIRLKSGQAVDTIIVSGTRTVEARSVPLEDLIKFYMPDFDKTYDKIYCCRCSKGLIIGRTNPGGTPYNVMVYIKSDAFTGINASKYVMSLPSHLGSIYGSDNGMESRLPYSTFTFDYISIYPAGSHIYEAINEKDVFIKENRYIPIANSFDKELNLSAALFFKVELFDKSLEDFIVIKFHNDLTANTSIYDLNNWSIGTANSYIAIENNKDLLNDTSYSLESYNIDEEIFLSSSVDIKDAYEITNHTILNTEQFMISTDNEEVTIKYDYYDGTEKKSHLIKYEEIVVEEDGFNKLAYSNIDTIYHISLLSFEGEYLQDIQEYEILKDQGIIVWRNYELIKNSSKVYLVYTIKKPIAFIFGLDYLYKAVNYDVDAYEHFMTHNLINLQNKEVLNLNTLNGFDETDLVFVSCDEPTFEAQLDKNIVTFNKSIQKNTLLIKTGYYYINGREYYLFSEENNDEVKNLKFYEPHNIDISGGEFTTYKATNNYVNNSEMRLKGMAELYHFDCTKPLTYGISRFNSLTSCESFNNWRTFGMKLNLVDGLNGLALSFTSEINNAYSFIDITDSLLHTDSNYLSFYASKEIKTFIGIEENYLGIRFERPINITIDHELKYNETDIRYDIISKNKSARYYLIIQGNGVIDDIIISSNPNSIYEAHTKNISLLGFDLYERKVEGSQYKMILNTHKDYTSYFAGLMSDGSIKTTSSVDWYVTQIKSFVNDEDFKDCYLTNIGVNTDHIFTMDREGYFETQPIYIGDVDNIKNLIFKINDIDFNNMKGFSSTVEISDRYSGEYIPCATNITSNKFHIPQSHLNKYIKLKIKMPFYKYINSIHIFAEYISTNDNPLGIITKQSGYIESKVYDLQELTNCRVKSIDLEDISNINDVSIQIRCSRDADRLDVWNNWHEIKLNDKHSIANPITLNNTRFLQFKIVLKNRDAFIKLTGINVEIK